MAAVPPTCANISSASVRMRSMDPRALMCIDRRAALRTESCTSNTAVGPHMCSRQVRASASRRAHLFMSLSRHLWVTIACSRQSRALDPATSSAFAARLETSSSTTTHTWLTCSTRDFWHDAILPRSSEAKTCCANSCDTRFMLLRSRTSFPLRLCMAVSASPISSFTRCSSPSSSSRLLASASARLARLPLSDSMTSSSTLMVAKHFCVCSWRR
mmetsp:Transcript_10405/g.18706  ORF Transcript_10405/g.18706 Transcript_10405/m.18706 type:complete len:215 (+) Transcript_10405:351-995(+)